MSGSDESSPSEESAPRRAARSSATSPIGVGPSHQPESPVEQSIAWWLFLGLLLVGAVVLFVGPANSGEQASQTEVEGRTENRAGLTDEPANSNPTEAASGAEAGTTPAAGGFTLVAGGDVLVHESVAASAASGDGFDFGPQFAPAAPIISGADIAICHLEVPLSATNNDLEYYPAFRVPNQLAPALANAGFDSCSMASNHTLDAGPAGVTSTLDQLDQVGITHPGAARSADEAATVTLLEVQPDIFVGHLSYTYGFNGTDLPADQPWLSNLIDADRILADAAESRAAGADFVVVSLHWGLEYQTDLTDQQREIAPRLLASADIDLLIGHHAHVVQPVERIGDKYVAYGLGNFLSNQSPETCSTCPIGVEDGVLLHFDISRNAEGRFVVDEVSAIPTWVNRTSGHTIVPTSDASAGADPAALEASAARTRTALGPAVS